MTEINKLFFSLKGLQLRVNLCSYLHFDGIYLQPMNTLLIQFPLFDECPSFLYSFEWTLISGDLFLQIPKLTFFRGPLIFSFFFQSYFLISIEIRQSFCLIFLRFQNLMVSLSSFLGILIENVSICWHLLSDVYYCSFWRLLSSLNGIFQEIFLLL